MTVKSDLPQGTQLKEAGADQNVVGRPPYTLAGIQRLL